MIARPAIFQWRQTEPGLILCAVRRPGGIFVISLSLRDVEELLEERGLNVDHTTVWRWVQDYGPEFEQRPRRHLKPPNKSWRVDETYHTPSGPAVDGTDGAQRDHAEVEISGQQQVSAA